MSKHTNSITLCTHQYTISENVHTAAVLSSSSRVKKKSPKSTLLFSWHEFQPTRKLFEKDAVVSGACTKASLYRKQDKNTAPNRQRPHPLVYTRSNNLATRLISGGDEDEGGGGKWPDGFRGRKNVIWTFAIVCRRRTLVKARSYRSQTHTQTGTERKPKRLCLAFLGFSDHPVLVRYWSVCVCLYCRQWPQQQGRHLIRLN